MINHLKREKRKIGFFNARQVWGFTLIELIVVISISIMLTAIVISYTRGGEKQIIFFKEQTLLVNSILRAKSFAVQTFQPRIEPGAENVNKSERICGWGVSFSVDGSEGKYVIFRDLATSPTAKCSDALGANNQYDPNDPSREEKFEEFKLPESIKIACLVLNDDLNKDCSGSTDRIDIVFIPPDPKIVFYSDPDKKKSEAVIKIKLNDDSRESIIRISKSGQISYK